MIKPVLFISALVLFSCSSDKDTAFCDCLEATETLNNYSQQFMSKTPNETESMKIKDLHAKKDSICATFEMIDGPTAKKKKEACEE